MAYRIFRIPVFAGMAAWLLVAASSGAAETLPELVAYALTHHPALQAREASVRAAEEATSPARTWPDPQLMLGVTNIGLTKWTVGSQPMSLISLQLSQRVPWRGTLPLAHEVAKGDVAQADALVEVERNHLAAEVARAALEIYRLDETIEIESSIRDTYQQMARAVEGLVAVGSTPQEDLISVVLDVEATAARIEEATQRRPALVARLNSLLNRPPTAPFERLAVAPLVRVPEDTAALVAAALRDQPRLAQWRAAIRQAETMRELAVRRRIPDPVITARYAFRGSLDDLYQVGIGMSLPIWMDRRQDADVRKTSEMLQMRRHMARAEELRTVEMVDAAVARLRARQELIDAYGEQLLPRARQVVDAAFASYSVGKTSLIMVLDAVRKWHRLRLEALNLEVIQRMDFVTLEEALGHAARIAQGGSPYVR